jgi:transcriptional regulator of acetoin/glycerol metabolism
LELDEQKEKAAAEQHTVSDALLDNRARREELGREIDDARQELQGLLVRGKADGLEVAQMAREAGISRETAYKLMRQSDRASQRQSHRRARAAGIPPGRARAEWVRKEKGA